MSISEQYEVYPYPERDPRDERKRLIRGSSSWPVEMDHHLWGGARDWSRPVRILVAGGGTGDGLVQMAQILTTAGRPYQITYLDLSHAARAIAEARIAERGLQGVTFHTASLLDAADFGPFDYIDCCGVLHHLPDPSAGFSALSAALTAEGGIGLMVYAPYGRSGVYPLQAAFGALSQGQSAEDRLAMGKSIAARLSDGHPFQRNPNLNDHKVSDAGFYDLLLHSRDRPYTVAEVLTELDMAGLQLAGFVPSALYDLTDLLPKDMAVPASVHPHQRMAIAEALRGTIKTHVVYATKSGRTAPTVKPGDARAVPHLKGITGPDLAQMAHAGQRIEMEFQTMPIVLDLPKDSAPLIAQIDGQTPLGAIRDRAGLDGFLFAGRWGAVHKALVP